MGWQIDQCLCRLTMCTFWTWIPVDTEILQNGLTHLITFSQVTQVYTQSLNREMRPLHQVILLSGCPKLASVVTCMTDFVAQIASNLMAQIFVEGMPPDFSSCYYSLLVLPCNLECLSPPLSETRPVAIMTQSDTLSSWFQADPHIYPRPSNTWHHVPVSHTEGWSTDQVSISHMVTGLSTGLCVSTCCCTICEADIIML